MNTTSVDLSAGEVHASYADGELAAAGAKRATSTRPSDDFSLSIEDRAGESGVRFGLGLSWKALGPLGELLGSVLGRGGGKGYAAGNASETAPAKKAKAAKEASETKEIKETKSKKGTTTKSKTTESEKGPKVGTQASPKVAPPKKEAKGEFAFLDDPRLSIEEKLFRFMCLVQEKLEQELIEKMKQYQGMKEGNGPGEKGGTSLAAGLGVSEPSKAGGAASGGPVGFLCDFLSNVCPVFKLATMLLSREEFSSLGGVLGTLAPLAAPYLGPLAPVLQQVGSRVAGEIWDEMRGRVGGTTGNNGKAAAGSGGASSSTGTSSSKGSERANGEETKDEKILMLEIQRLEQKAQQIFNVISNILKSRHESTMNCIGNIR